MGKGEWCAAFAADFAFAFGYKREEVSRCFAGARLRVGVRGKERAVIVRASGENFFPRLCVRRFDAVPIRNLLQLLRRQSAEDEPEDIVVQIVAQAV